MTKVMTGYVIADQIASGAISLDDKVLISEKALENWWIKDVY